LTPELMAPGPAGWPWCGISIYGEDMARLDSGSDRRPPCSACAADQIYVRGRIRRAVVRAGLCREPYVLNLCESHLARLQGVLPKVESGLSGSINRTALKPRVQFDSTTELLLIRKSVS
jgi:hypothetical protein